MANLGLGLSKSAVGCCKITCSRMNTLCVWVVRLFDGLGSGLGPELLALPAQALGRACAGHLKLEHYSNAHAATDPQPTRDHDSQSLEYFGNPSVGQTCQLGLEHVAPSTSSRNLPKLLKTCEFDAKAWQPATPAAHQGQSPSRVEGCYMLLLGCADSKLS